MLRSFSHRYERLLYYFQPIVSLHFQVSCLVIRDKFLNVDGFRELATTVGKTGTGILVLENCDLTGPKIAALGEMCKDKKIQVEKNGTIETFSLDS